MIDFDGDGRIDAVDDFLFYGMTKGSESTEYISRSTKCKKSEPTSCKALWGEAALAYLLVLLGGGIGANVFTVLLGAVSGVIVLVWACGGLK